MPLLQPASFVFPSMERPVHSAIPSPMLHHMYAPHADSTRATKAGVGGWSRARAARVDAQLRKSDVRISTVGAGVQGGIPGQGSTPCPNAVAAAGTPDGGHSTHGISHRRTCRAGFAWAHARKPKRQPTLDPEDRGHPGKE
jgi:hypothetical protein